MVQEGHLDNQEFKNCCTTMKEHSGTTRGPIHLFAKLVKDLRFEVNEEHKWRISGKIVHIAEIDNHKGKLEARCGQS